MSNGIRDGIGNGDPNSPTPLFPSSLVPCKSPPHSFSPLRQPPASEPGPTTGGNAMKSQTYVVETVAGTWAMDCCDEMHAIDEVVFMEFHDKRDAEDAARAHRAEDRIDRTAYEARIARCCPTCGAAR